VHSWKEVSINVCSGQRRKSTKDEARNGDEADALSADLSTRWSGKKSPSSALALSGQQQSRTDVSNLGFLLGK